MTVAALILAVFALYFAALAMGENVSCAHEPCAWAGSASLVLAIGWALA